LNTNFDRLRRKTDRTLAKIAVLLGAALVAVFSLPSAASASGANFYQDCPYDTVICTFGARVAAPHGLACDTTSTSYGFTEVCIDYASDSVYVKDGRADGYGAVAHVWSANGVSSRYCANNQGEGWWVKCDFDWAEAGSHAVGGGYIVSWSTKQTVGMWNWSGK
jgi:hypothetical protein